MQSNQTSINRLTVLTEHLEAEKCFDSVLARFALSKATLQQCAFELRSALQLLGFMVGLR